LQRRHLIKKYYFSFFLVHVTKNPLLIVKNFDFLFFIGQQIFYNGDPGNFGIITLYPGYAYIIHNI